MGLCETLIQPKHKLLTNLNSIPLKFLGNSLLIDYKFINL